MSIVLTMTSIAIALGVSAAGGVMAAKEALASRCRNEETEETAIQPVQTRFTDEGLLTQTLEEHGFPVRREEDGTLSVNTSAGSLRYYQPEKGAAFWVQPYDLKSEEELEAHQEELAEEYMVNVQKSTYLLLKQRLKERRDMELESEAVLEDQSILLTINVS